MSEASDIQRRFSLFEQGLLDEDATNELRQDIYDIASARDLDLFEDERTTSGQIYEMGKGAARGFLSSFATLGEGLGEQADALTNLIGAEDFIDSGEENELVRISREAQESIQERLGADVAYRDQWLTKFGEGVGSFGSFLVPGGALKTLGLGKTALGVTTTQAAGVGAGEQAQRIERAREQGIEVSPEQEDAAILWGSGVGLTELAPVQRILSKISKSADADFKKGIATRLKSALVSGGVEGLQEVTASILQDAVERGVYNESLPFNDSLLDDFTVGGAVGAFADLAVSAAAGRGRDRRNIVAERELREAEQQDIQTVAERVSEGQEQERARMLAAEGTSPEFLRGEVEELTATPDFIVEDDATPDDLLDFQETLDKEMAGVGLSDVKANIFHSLRNVLRNREGNLVYGIRTRRRDDQDVRLFGGQSGIVIEESPETAEGQVAEGLYSNAAGEIFLAADALPKEGTPDQQRDAAVGVLRHEQLHAMRALDLFTDSEWNILTNAVNQKNKKGTSGSYADWARGEYSNLSPIEQTEEAVAEMTRDLRADKTIVTGKPRTLIQRIIDFFPKLNSFLLGRGYTSFDSLIRDIDSGKIGGRKRGEIRTLRALEEAGQAPRVPDFDPSATINQEREEDFPDPERADKLSVRKTDDDDPDRIFPDLPLSARRRGLSQAFLKENGYEEYDPDFMLDGRPDYDHYISNADGSVVAYNYQGKDVSGKAKFSRKTFRNPTLNSLINWMEGGGQRTAAPEVDEKVSFENLYERYASGLLTEGEFNSELVNIKPSDLDKKPEDSDELRKAKSDAVRRISNIDRHGKDVEDENFKFLKTIPTDKFGNELPQFLYHNVYQRGFNQSGGISKYTFQPTDAYRGEKNLENMVMLSRAPISDGAARIDVSKLPDYKKKLVDLVMSEGHFSYKGDIPSNAIIEKDVSKKEVDTSYRIDHQPRRGSADEAVRLDDLTRTISGLKAGYPEELYSPAGRRIYAPGPRFTSDEYGKANDESMSVIYSSRGKPDNTVTMYRAVPKNVDQINVGDFVTISPTYAEVHASSGYGNDGQQAGKVISQEVKVRDLIWQTDDVNEFGYFPEPLNVFPEFNDKFSIRAYHGSPYHFPAAQRYRNKKTGKNYVADLGNELHQRIVGDSSVYEAIGEPSEIGLFDSNRINTGEGAQMMGRGLYFAEEKKVAEEYRKNLIGKTGFQDLDDAGRDLKGALYEVEIQADPDLFLDLSNLLEDQSPKLLEKLEKADWWPYAEDAVYESASYRGDNPVGLDLLRWLEQDGKEAAADALSSLGIKGTKFFDAFSRHKREDSSKTRNYVVFDDQIIDIKNKFSKKSNVLDLNNPNSEVELDAAINDKMSVRSSKFQTNKRVPKKTKEAYKLFRVDKNQVVVDEDKMTVEVKDGAAFYPLFVDKNEEVVTNEWVAAESGQPVKDEDGNIVGVLSAIGKTVEIGGKKFQILAYRPGMHSGDRPSATHIGGKAAVGDSEVNYRKANQVWAKVQVGADQYKKWSKQAKEKGTKENGKFVAKEAELKEVPEFGYYRYKTNPNMEGNWLISGEIKILGKALTAKQRESIRKKLNTEDLPLLPEVIKKRKLGLEDLTGESITELKTFYPKTLKKLTPKYVRYAKSLSPKDRNTKGRGGVLPSLEHVAFLGKVAPELVDKSPQRKAPSKKDRVRADGSAVIKDGVAKPKVTRDAGAVNKVVSENEKAATTPSVSVPPFSQLADPEAQYVAKNPEEGIKPTPELKDKFSRRSEPEMSPEISKLIDGIAAEPSLPVTPGETYLDVTKSSKLDFYLDKAKQAAINKYARLERYSRDPVFKDNLADTSAIAAAYFADRSMGVTASALKYGVPVYENGITRVKAFYHNGKQYRGLIDVMAPLYQNDYNVSLERLAQAYAIAKRTEDKTITRPDGSTYVIKGLRSRGIDSPVSAGQLKEIEAEIAKYKNKEGVPIIEEWYEVWQAYNNKTVEFMKATGIVDDALAQKWIEMSDYVPFYRQGEVEDGEIANITTNAPVMFKKNMTTAIKLKRLVGSESAVNVPMLDAITRNLSMAIDAGMKNVAQQRIVRDMLKIGLATKANRAQRKNASQNFVVNFKVNGVDQYYKIHDPLIYESLQSVEETTGLVTTAFGFPSKWLRELVTRDPGFMLANMMRDTLSAYVTSGADFTPVVDTVSNLGKDIEALESFGVVGGYDFMNDPDDMVKAFSKESKKRGINVDGKNAIFNPFKAVWNWAGQGTTLSDAATRKAVYEDVLARTGNEAEAAFQALEVINFSRRGRNPAVRFLTTAIPFLNARFQGLDVLYRGFMGYNPAQRNLTRGQATLTALSRASLITASTLAYWLMFSDSEEYKESTDEQRDLNWIFPNPFGERPIRIPVPFEVGLLFKTIPERIFDTYDVAKVFGKPGATTDRELFESIVVRGVGSTLEINPLGVQAVGPLFEAVINHNSFTGAPIVPVYVDKNGIEGFLGLESSTEFSKALGLAMDINPRKIDHVLYGYGGTIGAYIIDTIDRGIFKNPDIFDKDSAPPTMTIDQYPVVKRFLINKFSSGDRQDFYRLRREIDKVSGTLKDLEEAKRYDELEAVLRSKGHLLAIEKDVDYISRQLTKLRNERQEIERAPLSLISAEEKTEEINRILEEMDYYVRDVPKLKKYANLPATAGIPLSDVVDILSK